jgi:hypothetical protein
MQEPVPARGKQTIVAAIDFGSSFTIGRHQKLNLAENCMDRAGNWFVIP